ncbi:hypothetical protein [Spirosoma oryzicola]|uniref:hypothetical protein n=1 Tax=Spirosoma oryzicola TaxID=2898794 RepID=UPI001E5263B6|nr:hypothetical protein [Spirosoma oryzicola]UHG93368.1 hypothetical protein LQ777_10795 [Spirosoma oryzicola]
MAKLQDKPTRTVQVICDPSTTFGIGSDTIRVGDLTLEQAELVADQHPGQYVLINDPKTSSEA